MALHRIALAVCLAFGFAVGAAEAEAVDLPVRKAGLWEIQMLRSGGGAVDMTMQQYTDPTVDAEMSTTFSPVTKDVCSKNETTKTASGYVTESVCKFGSITTRSHTEITGDFNAAYTVKVTTQREGGPAALPQDGATTIEAKWIGACKSDQKPGDMIMPGGVKMNLRDLQKFRSLTPK